MQGGISLPDAPLDAEFPAPAIWASWSDMRDHLKAVLRQHGRPADRFLLVGDTTTERSWAEAAQTAGYMTAQDYFGQSLR